MATFDGREEVQESLGAGNGEEARHVWRLKSFHSTSGSQTLRGSPLQRRCGFPTAHPVNIEMEEAVRDWLFQPVEVPWQASWPLPHSDGALEWLDGLRAQVEDVRQGIGFGLAEDICADEGWEIEKGSSQCIQLLWILGRLQIEATGEFVRHFHSIPEVRGCLALTFLWRDGDKGNLMATIWLITGVGSGLGKAIAKAALARGDTVAGVLRNAEAATTFEALAPGRAHAFIADVCNRAEVFAAIDSAISLLGGIDVVVNNAGQVLESYVEEAEPESVRNLFEVNVLGPLNVIQAILPHFRSARQGLIVNVSSGGGIEGVPVVGLYSASKFALEGLSEALRKEVAPFGIAVTIVEPGAFRTNLLVHSRTSISNSIPDYEHSLGKFRTAMIGMAGNEPGDPDKLALAMLQLADSDSPPLRLILGDDARQMARNKADSILGDLQNWRVVGSNLGFEDDD